jgi:hypothetical protein
LIFFGAGAVAGIAGYQYHKGALTVIYQASFMETWDSSLKALDQMNIKVQNSAHDTTSGKITATQSDGKEVTVSLKYRTAQETEAVIRVGHLGDKDRSMTIKEEIRRILVKE